MSNIIKIKGINIEAVYGCVPNNVVDNKEDLLRLCDEKEATNIVKATGIYKRTVVKKQTSSLDLCLDCAKKMIDDKVFVPEDIGAVIFVTFTPERILPFNAALVQSELGLDKSVMAFDINLACSGYAYGLWNAATISNQIGKKVLLLDGDVQSAYLSGMDKATVPVLADAGSCTLINYHEQNDNESYFSFYTDGSGREALTIKAGGTKDRILKENLEIKECDDGNKRRDIDIFMDGFEVFRFVSQTVSKILTEFIGKTIGNTDMIETFVPHQANMYMIKQLAKKLKIPWDNTWKSGEEVGNSGSATIPVTIALNANDMLKKEKTMTLIVGFGGGLSASMALISLDKSSKYKFYKYEEE